MELESAFRTAALALTLFLVACAQTKSSPTMDASVDSGSDAATGGWSIPPGTPLRNVDIAVIYPLPSIDEESLLLMPSNAGDKGALLTAEPFVTGVPELDQRDPLPNDSERLGALHVVAVRFDVCPGVAHVQLGDCKPDIRLVFQSLKIGSAPTSARDGAIHAFYQLTQDEFLAVISELRALRAERLTEAESRLDVNPELRRHGLDSSYPRRLHHLILKYAGVQNLVRVTHFSRAADTGPFPTWTFGLSERPAGTWAAQTIATTNTQEQALTTIVGGRWDAQIVPALSGMTDDPTALARASSDEERRAGVHSLVRVLNPHIYTSETIDCASCHLAPPLKQFFDQLSGGDPWAATDTDRFMSSYSTDVAHMSDTTAAGFEHIHMISYLGTELSVTDRVGNETAAELEILNAQ